MAKIIVHRLFFFWNEDWCWNIFDFILVIMVLLENFITIVSQGSAVNVTFLRIMRLFKLARVLRIMRTFRFFTELRLMMECVIGSFMNVLWCVALLFIVQSIFALLIAQALVGYWMEHGPEAPGADKLKEFYQTVPDIMAPC